MKVCLNDIYIIDKTTKDVKPIQNGDKDTMNKMPKLETGMFVENGFKDIGVVVGNTIVYNNGSYDKVDNLYEYSKDYPELEGYIKKVFICEFGFEKAEEEKDKPENIIWEYGVSEVTMEDVYKKFGHKVKIIL
jgi:hypothetical protein